MSGRLFSKATVDLWLCNAGPKDLLGSSFEEYDCRKGLRRFHRQVPLGWCLLLVAAKYCMAPKAELGVDGCDKMLTAGSQTLDIWY